MIASRLRMNNASKSSITRLVSYLTNTQGKASRVLDMRITNCESTVPDWAAMEMLAVQQQNTRATGDKTYHLILSFHEKPSSELLAEMEQRACDTLGFHDHQRVSVLHGDTENYHVHLAINKIHPTTLTMHEPYYDKKTLARVCTQLEKEFRLVPDNHISKAQARSSTATKMERAGDMESLTGWIQRNCLSELQNAKDWKTFHHVLLKNGLSLKPRANGFVFVSGGIHVKASSIDRELSKKNLEMRLGNFEKCHENLVMPNKVYRRKPLSSGYEKLWHSFHDEKAQLSSGRQQLQEDRQKTFDSALGDFRLRNLLIRQMTSGRLNKMILYHLSQKKLQQQVRKDQWMDWLRETAREELNPHAAEALTYLRSRNVSRRRENGGYISGVEKVPLGKPQVVTRKGTRIFPGNIRERDGCILIPKNPTPQEIQSIKRFTEKHFDKITVHGDTRLKDLFGVAEHKPQVVSRSQSKAQDMDSGIER